MLVDFYAGKHHTASCAGTLIAQNVVLTAAHSNQSTNPYTADYTKCSYDLSGDP